MKTRICPECAGKGLIADYWSMVLNDELVLVACPKCGGIGLVLTN